ncbi:MAG: ATP-binding protein [Verrucomicrobiota bacterium]
MQTLDIALLVGIPVLGWLVWSQHRHLLAMRERLERLSRDAESAAAAHQSAAPDPQAGEILDSLPEAILLVDERLTVQFANRAVSRFFPGFRLERGRLLVELGLDARIAELVRRCLGERKPLQEGLTVLQNEGPKGGRERHWMVDAIYLEKGRESFVRLLLRDETKTHRADQVRRDFVANASHELRTPLTLINGCLETLLEEDLEAAQAKRLLSMAQKNGERLARLVTDMNLLSRVQQTELPLQLESFSLEESIETVVERLAPLIERFQADLRVKIAEELGRVRGDRFYWEQILFNLLDNALKNNPHRGLKLKIRGERSENGWRLVVADNGIGIPASKLPFIFDRFYRVQKDRAQNIQGTGLGLAIVKRAVEAHGGLIRAESVPGKRTAFVIEVPSAVETPADSALVR